MPKVVLEIIGLIALGVGSRLIPHLPNMTALSAVALKSRVRFGTLGLVLPIVSMLISDILIGFYEWRLLVSVYASFVLVGMLGTFLTKISAVRVAGISMLGSLLFFLITNSIVWATSPWYAKTIIGLVTAYSAGIPFLIAMLFGDVLFSLALFHGFSWILIKRFTGNAENTPQLAAGYESAYFQK
ncbi:MAG: DUF6580 family putative transport protein [Minisyncoccia bacterium]